MYFAKQIPYCSRILYFVLLLPGGDKVIINCTDSTNTQNWWYQGQVRKPDNADQSSMNTTNENECGSYITVENRFHYQLLFVLAAPPCLFNLHFHLHNWPHILLIWVCCGVIFTFQIIHRRMAVRSLIDFIGQGLPNGQNTGFGTCNIGTS